MREPLENLPWCLSTFDFHVSPSRAMRDALQRIAHAWLTLLAGLLLGRVDDFDAAVLLPAAFTVFLADRPLFAIADDVELAGRSAGRTHRARHRIATAFAEAEVVLARAAL